jgi:hypothetical protein
MRQKMNRGHVNGIMEQLPEDIVRCLMAVVGPCRLGAFAGASKFVRKCAHGYIDAMLVGGVVGKHDNGYSQDLVDIKITISAKHDDGAENDILMTAYNCHIIRFDIGRYDHCSVTSEFTIQRNARHLRRFKLLPPPFVTKKVIACIVAHMQSVAMPVPDYLAGVDLTSFLQ